MSTTGMDEPAEYDIVVKKGSKFELEFTLEDDAGPRNFSGWSGKAQLLVAPGGPVLMDFQVTFPTPASGSVRVFAAASTTALIPATAQGYKDAALPNKFFPGYWDCFAGPTASSGVDDECLMQGIGKVYPRGTVR